MARTFRAGFDGGECVECGEEFEEGDSIGYDEDDELCCAACLEEAEADIEEAAELWKGFWGEHA